MMTYEEAKALASERTAAWNAYYESQGKPTLNDYEKCIENMPEDITNYNIITRSKGMMIAAESNGRVYEYPCYILAWGYGIPEEAFLSEDILKAPCWEVISRRETYDW